MPKKGNVIPIKPLEVLGCAFGMAAVLTACSSTKYVTPPTDPRKDKVPIVEVNAQVRRGDDPVTVMPPNSAGGTVFIDSGSTVQLDATASNPGLGVKTLSLALFNATGQQFYSYTALNPPNPQGQYLDFLGTYAHHDLLGRNPVFTVTSPLCSPDGADSTVTVFAGAKSFTGLKRSLVMKYAPFPVIKKRISGINHLDFAKDDDGDKFSGQNGFLVVKHNPGCDWPWSAGNHNSDYFFRGKKSLPACCKIESIEFRQFWPNCKEDYTIDVGEYDATLIDQANPYTTVSWHNACTGPWGTRNLYYAISFVVSVPLNVDLGEPVFDPGNSIDSVNPPEKDFGWTKPTQDCGTDGGGPNACAGDASLQVTADFAPTLLNGGTLKEVTIVGYCAYSAPPVATPAFSRTAESASLSGSRYILSFTQSGLSAGQWQVSIRFPGGNILTCLANAPGSVHLTDVSACQSGP